MSGEESPPKKRSRTIRHIAEERQAIIKRSYVLFKQTLTRDHPFPGGTDPRDTVPPPDANTLAIEAFDDACDEVEEDLDPAKDELELVRRRISWYSTLYTDVLHYHSSGLARHNFVAN